MVNTVGSAGVNSGQVLTSQQSSESNTGAPVEDSSKVKTDVSDKTLQDDVVTLSSGGNESGLPGDPDWPDPPKSGN